MIFHSLRKGAEHHAVLGQFFLISRGDGHTVEHRINSHVAQTFLLTQGNSKLVEGFKQLGIDFIKTCFFRLLLWRCVINDVLIIDRFIAQGSPIRLVQGEPVAKGFQPKVKEKFRLIFFG